MKRSTGYHEKEVNDTNRDAFVDVLQGVYRANAPLEDKIRALAYTNVSLLAAKQPNAVSKLPYFNPENKRLLSDVIRFRNRTRKRGRSSDR